MYANLQSQGSRSSSHKRARRACTARERPRAPGNATGKKQLRSGDTHWDRTQRTFSATSAMATLDSLTETTLWSQDGSTNPSSSRARLPDATPSSQRSSVMGQQKTSRPSVGEYMGVIRGVGHMTPTRSLCFSLDFNAVEMHMKLTSMFWVGVWRRTRIVGRPFLPLPTQTCTNSTFLSHHRFTHSSLFTPLSYSPTAASPSHTLTSKSRPHLSPAFLRLAQPSNLGQVTITVRATNPLPSVRLSKSGLAQTNQSKKTEISLSLHAFC